MSLKFFNNIYFKNIFWNFLNQFGKSGFQILVTLILARLLTPADFGIIAMVIILTQFAELIIDSGFLLGIVQIKDITQKELSSVFFINIFIGSVCTLTIYFTAPIIADLYDNENLVKVARYLSISCLFTASAVVQHGLMIREMNYKNRTIAQLASQLISGLIAIFLAKKGFGVMALVYYTITQNALSATLYWIQSKWKPSFYFNFKDLKRIWRFSSHILGVTILGNLAGRTDLFLIGKFFSPQLLGFYSKGKDFAMLPANVGSEVASLSLFPILSRLTGEDFNISYKRSLKILTLVSSISFGVLCINANEITMLLLGVGWKDAGIIFQLYFVVAFFYLINSFFTSVINATGKSRINFVKELIQAPIRIIMLVLIYYILSPDSTLPFIYFWIVYYIASNLYSQYLISVVCKIKYYRNITIGLQYIVLSVIIGSVTFFFIQLNSDILTIAIRTMVFLFIFAVILVMMKDPVWLLTNNFLKNNLWKKEK